MRVGAALLLGAAVCLLACTPKDVSLGSDEHATGQSGNAGAAGKGGKGKLDGGPAAGACPAGFGDCDGDPRNGCEADLTRDRGACGSCAVACKSPDCTCNNGQLTAQCSAERADCNGDPSDGCEVDVTSDAKHCGACEQSCQVIGFDAFGATCVDGHCQLTCESLHADCDADPSTGCEVNLYFDSKNCGACGVVCPCNGGRCQ